MEIGRGSINGGIDPDLVIPYPCWQYGIYRPETAGQGRGPINPNCLNGYGIAVVGCGWGDINITLTISSTNGSRTFIRPCIGALIARGLHHHRVTVNQPLKL